jgi:hypothetical protein
VESVEESPPTVNVCKRGACKQITSEITGKLGQSRAYKPFNCEETHTSCKSNAHGRQQVTIFKPGHQRRQQIVNKKILNHLNLTK